MFAAVITERADGHVFARDAVTRGATGVLAQHPVDLGDGPATCVIVPDTRQAMQDWARYIVRQRALDIIGITGSVGKTTAKEAIAAVLASTAPVFKNRANYNGLYGLPIALSELRPEHRVAVLEMAADHFGEIGKLAEIARPEHCRRDDRRARAPRNVRLARSNRTREGQPGRRAALRRPRRAERGRSTGSLLWPHRARSAVVTYGTSGVDGARPCPDICASDIITSREGVQFNVDTPAGARRVQIPLLGRHQVYAAFAAIAVGLAARD